MHRKHKGAHKELIACTWLLEQGYEVYRNVSSCGAVDIIAEKDGILIRFDIKSCLNIDKTNYKSLITDEQRKLGVKLLYVDNNNRCLIQTEAIDRTDRLCARCQKPFRPRKYNVKYCSNDCRVDSFLKEKKYAIDGNGYRFSTLRRL